MRELPRGSRILPWGKGGEGGHLELSYGAAHVRYSGIHDPTCTFSGAQLLLCRLHQQHIFSQALSPLFSQCYCSANLPADPLAVVEHDHCKDSCSGDPGQICGDSNKMSIYRVEKTDKGAILACFLKRAVILMWSAGRKCYTFSTNVVHRSIIFFNFCTRYKNSVSRSSLAF